ncbi:anti-sigma factor [Thalassobaculum litoreum]|uniref:Anti-sigma-K factor RskA n=1 Tax=Thalassobaculum litoreum DSM 18839 TaxID=1123362 RepID=A0A8G2BJI1_9PROT|nr:anti-sigma factor [Thalassobaculum litoreum]SDF73737.1 Anti-sigma-K factor RskA [Thalassobaculum litoreum DSM 18839]
MREREDIELTAAEYVLGTLTREERVAVEARRTREPALDAAIAVWERHLSPMLDDVAPVAPPPDLFPAIEAAIAGPAREGGGQDGARVGTRDGTVTDLARMRRRLGRWRAAAVGAAAIAACLAGVLVVREVILPPSRTFVAVFHDGDTQPRFLLSVDLESRELTIRPVTAEPVADKTYQLWIVGEGISPIPRSLGLLEDVSGTTRKRLDQVDPALLRNATFGISLEPPGGSPTGQPTGPALHGTLIPAED